MYALTRKISRQAGKQEADEETLCLAGGGWRNRHSRQASVGMETDSTFWRAILERCVKMLEKHLPCVSNLTLGIRPKEAS